MKKRLSIITMSILMGIANFMPIHAEEYTPEPTEDTFQEVEETSTPEPTENTPSLEEGFFDVEGDNGESFEIELLQPTYLTSQESDEKPTLNGITVESFYMELFKGASPLQEGKYIWNPYDSNADHLFAFRVYYSFSGIDTIPENAIEIRIPRKILIDRNGNYADKLEMTLSRFDDYLESDELVYSIEDNDVVIYNRKPLDAGYNGYFEVGYRTSKTTFDYKDSSANRYDTEMLGEFDAKLKLIDDTDELLVDAYDNNGNSTIKLWMNSFAKISKVEKRYPNNIYYNWQSEWGSKPADADAYYYLVWEIVSELNNVTQPYTFRLNDEPISEDVEIIGYKLNGQRTFTSNNEQTNQTYSGKRYDFVLTRHKISTYVATDKEIVNKATAVVIPEDGHDSESSKYSINTYRSKKTLPLLIDSQKSFYSYNKKWANSWGERPSDADDYEYVVWKVDSEIDNIANWEINWSIQDFPISENFEVVGYRFGSSGNFTTTNSAVITTNGKRSDYVLTRIGLPNCVDLVLRNSTTTTFRSANQYREFQEKSISSSAQTTIKALPTITSYTLNTPSQIPVWNNSWGEAPSDADEYEYIVWEVEIDIDNPRNISFNLEIQDDGSTNHEIVGYNLNSANNFGSDNTFTNVRGSGSKKIYVLSKYRKDIVSANGVTFTYSPSVTVSHNSGCEWSAIGRSGTHSFTYSGRSLSTPKEDFKIKKYGEYYYNGDLYTYKDNDYGKYGGYISYDLEKLKQGTIDKIENIKYDIEGSANGYFYSRNDDEPANNYLSYGQRPVKAILKDEEIRYDGNVLNENGYDFNEIKYSFTMLDADYNNIYKIFNPKSPNYSNETLDLIIKVNGEWIEGGQLSLADGEIVSINNDYVETFTANNIVFKNGVKGYQLSIDDIKYSFDFSANISLTLYRTDELLNYLETRSIIDIGNLVELTLYKDDESVKYGSSYAVDYIRSTDRDSQIKKRVVSATNNAKNKRYVISWNVNVDEQLTTRDNSKEYIPQNNGVFYDLLPLSCTLDTNSISIKTEKGYLDEHLYSFSQIPNFRESNRTLLIINVNDTFNFANVYYNTLHSWESIKDYGSNVYNPVAYETGNKSIAQGYPDNGGEIVEKELFTNLNEDINNENKFIYSEARFDISALTSAASGLTKKVRSIDDNSYSYETETTTNGDYLYRIRYMTSFSSKAKNLIFMDTLENYVTPEGGTSQWKGTIQSIDVSQLIQKGIEPKVYLSRIDNLNLDENNNIANTEIWIPINEFGDISEAKAFAIDMSKRSDGTDYILENASSVTAIIYMKAPEEVIDLGSIYPETYNNIYIHNTVIDEQNNEQDFFIHQDYTTVKYHVAQDFSILKVNEEDINEVIPNISFRLYGISDYGKHYDITLTTNNNGAITFKNIEKGQYKLQEVSGVVDFVEDHTAHDIVITPQRNVLFDGEISENRVITITNKPRIYTSFNIQKNSEGDSDEIITEKTRLSSSSLNDEIEYRGKTYIVTNKELFRIELTEKDPEENTEPEVIIVSTNINRIDGIPNTTFRLYGTSEYGRNYSEVVTSDSTGKITFDDIEIGTYYLQEIQPNEDFVKNNTIWKVTVNEDKTINITSDENKRDRLYEVGEAKDGTPTFYNERRYYSFVLRKIDSENESIWLEGAKFNLKGISDLGTEYNLDVTSDQNGKVVFGKVEKGTYILSETEAPTNVDSDGHVGGNRNYIKDPNKYIVKVNDEGNVLIEGLPRNIDDEYTVRNDRALDGKITITKIWKDNDSSQRKAPVVHLTSGEPEGLSRIVITYNAGEGTFGDTSINKIIYQGDIIEGIFSGEISEGEYKEPTLEGYVFVGWYIDQDLSIQWDNQIRDTNITLYAKYQLVEGGE